MDTINFVAPAEVSVTGQASSTPGPDVATIPTGTTGTAPDSLPAGYLAGGYYATTQKAKYLRTEYVSSYAQALATSLASIKLTDFRKIVRDVKKAKKPLCPLRPGKPLLQRCSPKPLPWYTVERPQL